jgi:hypothetical protein
MTAYELAEIMTVHDESRIWEHGLEIANMLRQQADRIAELEGEVSHLKHINKNWSISEGWALQRIAELEKQSEPVAWIRSGDDQLSLVKEKDDGYMVWKPLYLAPQTKPLSDEEIISMFEHPDDFSCIEYARVIEERHGIK